MTGASESKEQRKPLPYLGEDERKEERKEEHGKTFSVIPNAIRGNNKKEPGLTDVGAVSEFGHRFMVETRTESVYVQCSVPGTVPGFLGARI